MSANIYSFDFATPVYSVSFTSAVTTTSSTFAQVDGLTLTPPAGTYIAHWSGNVAVTSGANGTGQIALFIDTTQQTVSTRSFGITVALLLGLIGTATTQPGGGESSMPLTVNGSQSINVKFKSVSGDTCQATQGILYLVRIS